MKKLLLLLALTPMLAWGQSPFDGTWKFDLGKSQPPKKPDVYLLQNGTYTCKTCVPMVQAKADGTEQKVTGHPYFDTITIKVVDDHNVEQSTMKDGKPAGSEKDSISPDGSTMTIDWTDNTPTTGGPVTGKAVMKRVAKGPAGAHLISGSWRTEKLEGVSDNGTVVTYKSTADGLNMTTPTGQSYTAKLDGSDAPYQGDPGTTSVSLKRVNDRTIEETDKRDGKVISVTKITVSPDGKMLTFDVNDKLHGSTSHWIANKQS